MKNLFLLLVCAVATGTVAWGDASSPSVINTSDTKAPVQDANSGMDELDNMLPIAEVRIIEGIRLQAHLHDTLATVKDKETAEAAAVSIRRLTLKMQKWAQGFAPLPPLDEDTKAQYESKYLPAIRTLNARIKAQGERIASAEYYGSLTLPSELLKLVKTFR